MPGPNSGPTESGPGSIRRGKPSGEFAAIARLAARLHGHGPQPAAGEVWIGDDAAVLRPTGGSWLLLTTDLVVAGVHGDMAVMGAADLGWRAMVASLSDIAAMGGRPCHAVVSIAGPPDTDLDSVVDGVAQAAREFCCPVVGGDLSGADQLVVSVAMTGDLPARANPVLRSGARAGDHLFVTGALGGSAAGLRLLRREADASGELVAAYRRPRPRTAAGVRARLGGATAMIDVSDGLAADLGHLADASDVGFDLLRVPVAAGASLDDALYGGEDYELVLACPEPAALLEAFRDGGLEPPIAIGNCVADCGRRTFEGRPLAAGGFEHDFA